MSVFFALVSYIDRLLDKKNETYLLGSQASLDYLSLKAYLP
jgi:hypothetical protein